MHSVLLFNHILMQSSWNICLHVGRSPIFSMCMNCSKYIWHSDPPNPSGPLIKKGSNDNKLITSGSSLTAVTGPAPLTGSTATGSTDASSATGSGRLAASWGWPCVHIQHKQKHPKMLKMMHERSYYNRSENSSTLKIG